VERVVRAVIVIQWEVIIPRVTLTMDSAIANLVLLDLDAINVTFINTDSLRKVVSHAIVMLVDRRAHSAMNLVSVRVTRMSKEDAVIAVKRTNMIDIRVVWTVLLATIWYKMLPTNIARNSLISIKF
jgi:hypothetical protein